MVTRFEQRAATLNPIGQERSATSAHRFIQVDFVDIQSLMSAARGADIVFAAGTGHAAGPRGDVRHGTNIADAARARL